MVLKQPPLNRRAMTTLKMELDNIVEFHKEEIFIIIHLALAIDETFSHDVDKKFKRIKRRNKTRRTDSNQIFYLRTFEYPRRIVQNTPRCHRH